MAKPKPEAYVQGPVPENPVMLTRRSLIAAPAIIGIAATPLLAPIASARAPLAGSASPGVYRFKVGSFEVTALSDGLIDLGVELFPEAAKDAASAGRLLTAAARANAKAVPTSVNGYVVNTGDRVVLVDTGTGPSTAFGPNLGRLTRNLVAAGIDPAAVDVVFLTHMHPDHVGGLAPQGQVAFPNAELVVGEAEYAFWTDQGIMSRAPVDFQPFFKGAQDAVKPYAARTRRIASGEIVPGVTIEAAPGHTVGHTMVRVFSGSQQLLIWGDVVHLAAFQFDKPDWSIAFDTDQDQARASRKRVFDMVTADNMIVAGMHLPFPGVGRVARDGQAFAYVPEIWPL